MQKVPLAGFTAQPTASFTAGDKKIDLKFPEDYVAVSRRFVAQSKVENSDMVFVGYGVVAPEYGWDDYKGLDVRGKTIVMLINDPAVPDRKRRFEARRQDLQRQGDDLLRPLDLQIRDCD